MSAGLLRAGSGPGQKKISLSPPLKWRTGETFTSQNMYIILGLRTSFRTVGSRQLVQPSHPPSLDGNGHQYL